MLDGNLLSVYNTLSYFPRNDLMLYGSIDWQQRKAKEPVDLRTAGRGKNV